MAQLPSSWKIVPINEMFEKISLKNKDRQSENVLTISAKDGLVNQETYFNKKIASKDLSNYFLLSNGDFAYNKSYSDGYPAGAIKKLAKYDDGVVSPLYICFRAICDEHLVEYYQHLFESGFLNQQILAVAKEGARNHGLLNVAKEDFFSLKVPVPDDETIHEILRAVNTVEKSVSSHELHFKNVSELQLSIINEVF